MAYKYAFQGFNSESMARAHEANLQISMKKSVELARALQGKKVSSAVIYLNQVIDQKAVVPYLRYIKEMPHRRGKGIMAGGYPVNVAKGFLKVLENAQKNAAELEISGELYVLSSSSRQGSSRYHTGRYAGRKMKSTNVEVIVGVRK